MKISKLLLSGSGLMFVGGASLLFITKMQPTTATGIYWQKGFRINQLQNKVQTVKYKIDTVNLDVNDYDLIIKKTHAKQVKIKVHTLTREKPQIMTNSSKQLLQIKPANKTRGYQLQFGSKKRPQVIILMPKNIQLNKLKIKGRNSTTRINDGAFNKFNIVVNNGKMNIRNSKIKQLTGEINKTQLKIDKSLVAQMAIASNNSNVALRKIIWQNNSQVISQASDFILDNNQVGGYNVSNDNGIIKVNNRTYYNIYHSISNAKPMLRIDNNQGNITLNK